LNNFTDLSRLNVNLIAANVELSFCPVMRVAISHEVKKRQANSHHPHNPLNCRRSPFGPAKIVTHGRSWFRQKTTPFTVLQVNKLTVTFTHNKPLT